MDPQSHAAEMISIGAELFIGRGGINDDGKLSSKGLYCSNYRDLPKEMKH